MADNSLKKQLARGRGRPFLPGQSGNPGGRPPGRRNNATMAAEALLDDDCEQLTRRAIELAKRGNPIALKLCLDRILPPRRDRAVTIDMPPVNSAADIASATTAILDAIAAGILTPGEGQVVMNAYATARSIFETSELETRLRALEKGILQSERTRHASST
jgi:Family of unknown function (DUF5681)